MRNLVRLTATFGLFCSAFAQAEVIRIVPEEYETSGTSSVGAGLGGVASTSGVTAVRQNPALIAGNKEYALEGGFHWPVGGREFFQAGIVDGKTSSVAAGVSYTSFLSDFKTTPEESFWFDAPMKRRFAVAGAYSLAGLTLGVGGQYVEGFLLNYGDEGLLETKKGWTIGTGISGNLSQALRVAASVENMSNKKVQEFAPTIYRAGAQYLFSESFAVNLDYRRRQRVARFEGRPLEYDLSESDIPDLKPEQMIIGSAIARVHEYVSFVAGYGEALRDPEFDKRKVLSGGIVVSGKSASLAYSVSRPQMQRSASAHQAVQLNINVAM